MSLISMTLAGFKIVMDARYDFTVRQCRGYISDFPLEEADFSVSVSEEALKREILNGGAGGEQPSPGYAESICLYRELCLRLPQKNALLLHAAVIGDGSHAYAFTAPSGTGKSTHICRWREAFGEPIYVINGDKPILRLIDGVWWAYGTPWCGKEGWHTNTSRPLSALCFLSRGEEDQIFRMSPLEAVPALMHQVLLPSEPDMARSTMKLLDHLVTNVPLYRMKCTPTEAAARVAREAMMPKES